MENLSNILGNLTGYQRILAILAAGIIILGVVFINSHSGEKEVPNINQGGAQNSGASSTNSQNNSISI